MESLERVKSTVIVYGRCIGFEDKLLVVDPPSHVVGPNVAVIYCSEFSRVVCRYIDLMGCL